jgi:hypothetical protein
VTVRCGTLPVSFTGRRQSRATGRVAARLIRRLPGLPPGASHIEQLVEPVPFLTEPAGEGSALDFGDDPQDTLV